MIVVEAYSFGEDDMVARAYGHSNQETAAHAADACRPRSASLSDSNWPLRVLLPHPAATQVKGGWEGIQLGMHIDLYLTRLKGASLKHSHTLMPVATAHLPTS